MQPCSHALVHATTSLFMEPRLHAIQPNLMLCSQITPLHDGPQDKSHHAVPKKLSNAKRSPGGRCQKM
eukprot:scaffold129239_cov21-Tisochrysis_lutea.AAC.1